MGSKSVLFTSVKIESVINASNHTNAFLTQNIPSITPIVTHMINIFSAPCTCIYKCIGTQHLTMNQDELYDCLAVEPDATWKISEIFIPCTLRFTISMNSWHLEWSSQMSDWSLATMRQSHTMSDHAHSSTEIHRNNKRQRMMCESCTRSNTINAANNILAPSLTQTYENYQNFLDIPCTTPCYRRCGGARSRS